MNVSESNNKNYNSLDCDWFKKLLFSTNSLAKLLSASLLLKSLSSNSSITMVCFRFKVDQNSFQHLDFDGSLYPLFIT